MTSNFYINLFIISILTFLINFLINKFSNKYGYLSFPTKRNVHDIGTPYMGGITIILIILFTVKNMSFEKNYEIIILYSIPVVIIGLIDDIKDLNPNQKLTFISLPVLYLIFFENMIIADLGSYEFIGTIHLGKFGPIFTILAILLFVNAFNYTDGVDGLAITQFLVFICYINYLIDDKSISYALINLMVIYTVILICNFSNIKNIKTFLGDSGSLMTGFLISFLTILAYVKFQIHPIKLAYALSYPVYDFLRVNIIRLKNKKKLFQPSKDHLHHLILFKFTKNHFKVTLIITFYTIITIGFGNLIFFYLNSFFSLTFFVLNFFIYFFLIKKYFK